MEFVFPKGWTMGFYQMDRDFLKKLAADTELTAAELRVVLAIAANARLPGDAVEATAQELAKSIGMTVKSAKRARTCLLQKGFLVFVRTGTNNATFVRLGDTPASGDTDVPTVGTRMSPSAGVIHIKRNKETQTPSFSPATPSQGDWDPYEEYAMTREQRDALEQMFA